MNAPIRILIADDHPVVRDGLTAILGTQLDFAVVGEAANGMEVIRRLETLHPDLLLLDLAMPELDGVEALKRISVLPERPRVLVFTAFDTDERILAAVRAGAQGYLLKGTPREELFAAIRIVHNGGSLLQPIVAARLIRHIVTTDAEQEVSSLTGRETEVLQLLTQGLQNKEIAVRLGISERTVKFHMSSVFAKLGAGNRTEAVALAAQRGLVKIGD